MGLPAARLGEMHACPMMTGVVPHIGGPVIPAGEIVLIGGLPAARLGDMTAHGGAIVGGVGVLIN